MQFDSSAQIFTEVVSNIPQSVLAALLRREYLKIKIRNHRAFNDQPKPISVNELIIEGKYTESIGNMEMKDFCCMTIARMLIIEFYCLPLITTYLSLFAKSYTWFVDGNFGLAPEFFKQLYVIHVQINSYIAFCRKKISLHNEEIFSVVLNECRARDLSVKCTLRF
ncbi:Uncharacterized protein FWK35_00001559 [Aphis craccivora]|uniref:Uncharacterized protein n=1 Tax=Aphis craccivora TaxID=307492 RepID=A0A6G0ZCJ1_APHCR|nr:Uncharacterized protein FWK35_00001559 [Aphis craccivora]